MSKRSFSSSLRLALHAAAWLERINDCLFGLLCTDLLGSCFKAFDALIERVYWHRASLNVGLCHFARSLVVREIKLFAECGITGAGDPGIA